MVTSASDRRCSIWAVNSTNSPITLGHGTRLGTVAEIDELYTKSDDQQEDAAAGEGMTPIRPGLFGDQSEQSSYTAAGMSRPPTSVMHTYHGMAEVRVPRVAAAEGNQNPLRPGSWADRDATHDKFNHGKQDFCDTAAGMSRHPISVRPSAEAKAQSVAAEGEQSPVRPKPRAGLDVQEREEFDCEYLWDDYGMGMVDDDEMSHEEFDVEGAVLPPSVAVATCQAAESMSDSGTIQPDLTHLEEVEKGEVLQIIEQYRMLFDGGEDAVGLIPNIKHQIDTGDAKPVCT